METALLCVAFAVFAVVLFVWHFARSNSLLHEWAKRHHYGILRQEYRWFFKGPFFWTSSRGQTVYYVVVEDRHGNQGQGWVRCGGWFLGLLSDEVEVRWENKPIESAGGLFS